MEQCCSECRWYRVCLEDFGSINNLAAWRSMNMFVLGFNCWKENNGVRELEKKMKNIKVKVKQPIKKYIISENMLLNLLEDSHKLCALENGGVDNWDWYCESIHEYYRDMKVTNFMACAVKDLEDFTPVE